jgi:hypothetical protein
MTINKESLNIALPEGMFAKYVSVLTEWPKDNHRHGIGEDLRVII